MSKDTTYGVLAEFKDATELYYACEKVRDAGFKNWDAHSPFPIHGLDGAMGMGRSHVPWIVLVGGLTGAAAGMAMQWWTSAVDYPIYIAAKPMFSWQAFIPVTFEIMVLFAALGAVFGMFALNKLPQLYHPLFRSERFEGVTDDRFFISIEAQDANYQEGATADFLSEIGATHVETVES
jgi:hypothetical protein